MFMDGEVHWYEGLAFFMLYMVYIGFMSQNERIATMARKMVSGTKVHSGGNADEPDNAKGALNADAGEKDGDEDTKVGNLQVCVLPAITTALLHSLFLHFVSALRACNNSRPSILLVPVGVCKI